MSKKPDHVTVIETFHNVKAKNLKKDDNVSVGTRSYRVKRRPTKDPDSKTVVIELRWGTRRRKDEVTLLVHRNFPFNVRRISRTNNR